MIRAGRVLVLLGVVGFVGAEMALYGAMIRTERIEEHRDRLASRVEVLEGNEAVMEGARRARVAAVDVDRLFRRSTTVLVDLGDDAAHALLEETTTAKPSEAERAAAFTRIRGVVAAAKSVPGARVAMYEQPATVTGWASIDKSEWNVGVGWDGRAPEALLRGEFAKASSSAPADSPLVWFTPEADGAVRLHVLQAYQHSYEVEGKGEPVEAIRLVESSAPFAPLQGMALDVRCDVVDGAVVQDPVRRAVKGDRVEGPGDELADALLPDDHAVRFASGAKGPRATVAVPREPTSSTLTSLEGSRPAAATSGPLRLWFFFLLLAVALLFGAVIGELKAQRVKVLAPDITAEAAHELKTPLTAMRGELEVALRRERTPVEYRETIAGCLEEVKGLQELVSQVLLLSRGMATARADEEVDLSAVIRAEVERTRAASPDRVVEFAAPDGAVLVRGDPSLLARAVGNLLDNAALHSVAGGAIRARIARSERGAIEATVEDDGPGIPEARRERVFERFYRGPEVGQRGIPGAGLGLPIARFIAEAHGGTLALDPQVSGRARFVLRLPAPAPALNVKS